MKHKHDDKGHGAAQTAADAGPGQHISPEQALANTRQLLKDKQAKDRQGPDYPDASRPKARHEDDALPDAQQPQGISDEARYGEGEFASRRKNDTDS